MRGGGGGKFLKLNKRGGGVIIQYLRVSTKQIFVLFPV